jgi:hypothetical protein
LQRVDLRLGDQELPQELLADHYGCPVSDAIRRSLIAHRNSGAGVPKGIRQQRVRVLKRLFEMFEGNDANDEVRRLKMEDQGF